MVGVDCHGNLALNLYNNLARTGAVIQEVAGQDGAKRRLITFGAGTPHTQCAFDYLDRDGNSINFHFCAIRLDLSPVLLPHIGF